MAGHEYADRDITIHRERERERDGMRSQVERDRIDLQTRERNVHRR